MAAAYYNEIDPYAAQWLRNLIDAGHIAAGDVDERSILDVSPDDLAGYTQCHFFAGVGVWSYALRSAGWPDERPVWTGSCPCQPFSVAGVGSGFDDERHLWPFWHFLIEQRRPPVVFGEQVEAAIKHGWLDLVQADMEGISYAFGAVGAPAAGVGAPHIRQRLYFVADTDDAGFSTRREGRPPMGYRTPPESDRSLSQLGNADDAGLEGFGSGHKTEGGRVGEVRPVAPASESCRVEYATGDGREQRGTESGRGSITAGCPLSGLADSEHPMSPRGEFAKQLAANGKRQASRFDTFSQNVSGYAEPGPVNGLWRDADWLFCRDGKWRPVEPGTFPLAHGAPARVGRLRAYGNAIVAEAAAQFIAAYMECRP